MANAGRIARLRLSGKDEMPMKKESAKFDKSSPEIRVSDWVAEAKESKDVKYKTPSDSPFPVYVACQPCFVDNEVANNVWIKELKGDDKEIDHDAFMGEWYNFYRILSANALVYLMPPKKGLQDEVYVNSFCYLPHLKNKNIVILSNFTAPGRAGEEEVARQFLTPMGYECVKPPYKFEGWPELKWIRDNIYFGGYGFRTDPKFHSWFEARYGAKVVKIKEKDEYCYHLDCNLFVIDEENVIVCTETIDKVTIKEIEKVANIFPVTDDDCYEDACNIVRAGSILIASSAIKTMKKNDPLYLKQKHKNDRLEEICKEMGLELILLNLEELAKSGAATSCLVTPLNHNR